MTSASLHDCGLPAGAAVPEGRSFRDPDGSLVQAGGRILRCVAKAAAARLRIFLASPAAQDLFEAGKLIPTWELPEREQEALGRTWSFEEGRPAEAAWFEHEKVPFPSYPYEWSPGMLHSAARLTLDLSSRLHPAGLGLKDATPYNVLFRGPSPVFIDLLSIERRQPGDAVWRPYAQFASTFLLPLAINRRYGLAIQGLLLVNRDGIDPEQAWRLLSPGARLRAPFLGLVTIPELLRRAGAVRESHYSARSTGNPERASFVLEFFYRRLRRQVGKLEPNARTESTWTGYMGNLSYGREEFEAKEKFVAEVLARQTPRRVLDVGCNTGAFSLMAAREGAEVVAIDSDEAVIDRLWRTASAQKLNILPLVTNLARPTPRMGWRNAECGSFLDRASGRFDLVLMLAVIHHMMVSERIPIGEIMALASDLTTEAVVVEYVDPADPMFRAIARGRGHLHAGFNPDVFRSCSERWFKVERTLEISPTRRLFHLRKK